MYTRVNTRSYMRKHSVVYALLCFTLLCSATHPHKVSKKYCVLSRDLHFMVTPCHIYILLGSLVMGHVEVIIFLFKFTNQFITLDTSLVFSSV